MHIAVIVLLILAAVSFLIATIPHPAIPPRVNFIALGLLLWVVAVLIPVVKNG
jgi:hypothetical protein